MRRPCTASRPDLTTLGKIIGGGMPVGAFGGRRDIMEQLAPLGPVYQAGTLSGNPVAMARALPRSTSSQQPGFHARLGLQTQRLVSGLARARRAPRRCPRDQSCAAACSASSFTDQPTVTSYAQATACDLERFKRFFHAMLDEGVYLAPSAFEAGFLSSAHGDADIDATISAATRAFARC